MTQHPSGQPSAVSALIRALDRQLDDDERRALIDWAARLLEIRASDLPPLNKARTALDATYRAEVVVPILAGAGGALKDLVWDDRSWGARLGLGATAVTAAALGGQGAGVAALGGAVAIPLWIVLGAGAEFAGALIRQLGASPSVHRIREAGAPAESMEEAEWELVSDARLPVAGAVEPPSRPEPLWRVFRKAYGNARIRQREEMNREPHEPFPSRLR